MSDEFLAWKKLSESDIRSMLIALVGYDFGREPENRIPEIRESRKSYSNYIGDQIALTSSDVVVDLGSDAASVPTGSRSGPALFTLATSVPHT
jgi:hypothetical protein